jgi:hypothetical protein
MRHLSALAAVALVFSVTAALADPVGKYDIEGTNPGSDTTYSGTVSVERTGQTYRVVWVVGGTRSIGTGVGNKDFISVSYKTGSYTGLALYAPEGDGWVGVWTYAGGTQLGAERWTRQ